MSNPFSDDVLKAFFGGGTAPKARPQATDKPLPAIRGKRIDDVLYVRAEDVANALESQAPGANKRLIAKLRAAAL